MEDKYKLFKNYMHNELGISKEDIHQWVTATIKEEVKNVVDSAYSKCDLHATIKRSIMDTGLYSNGGLNREVLNAVSKELAKEILSKLNIEYNPGEVM